MLVSEKKRSFCEHSDMNEKSFVSFVADTYLENRIQNIKYSVNHEPSSRPGLRMRNECTCARRDALGRPEADIQQISASEENLFSERQMQGG